MPTGPLVFVPLAALCVALLALLLPARVRGLCALGAAAVACLTTASAYVERQPAVPERDVVARPIAAFDDGDLRMGGYVGSSACRACHAHEHSTWRDSYHRSMTQVVSPATVLADFDDVTMEVKGEIYRLTRDGDRFYVELSDPLAPPGRTPGRVRREVVLSTGSHHMQVYWFESGVTSEPDRTLGQLPFSWQVAERRWITRDASFVLPPDEGHSLQFSGWNMICIKCHATHGVPRLDTEGGKVRATDTRVAEFGIACEACHGPGAEHVAANRNPVRRYAQRLSGEPDPTIVNPKRLDHERATQICSQCHARWDYRFDQSRMNRWSENGFEYRPGDDPTTHRALDFEGKDQFWSDGLVRTAGRESNALAGSPCYEKGKMSCLSCHVMHPPDDGSRTRAEWADDQLFADDGRKSCVACHAEVAADVTAHSHHAVGSTGSDCLNCHMPHTSYGLMKGVRNHRIASPSVAVQLATGRPNACNQCHLDQPLGWTATHLASWYGIESPQLGDSDRRIAAGVRWALEGDAGQRALVAWTLGWQDAQAASGRDWLAPYLAELLVDPYPVVRIIAERSLRTLPGYETFRHQLDGGLPEREAAKRAALEIWRSGGAAAARAEVLMQVGGTIDDAEFRRLLGRRDLRKVRLDE
jgi:hypothetical protein